MTEFLFWCAALLLTTALLWAIPAARRMHGPVITGFKCIPPGCVTVLLVPVLGAAATVRTLELLSRFLSGPTAADLPKVAIIMLSLPFFRFPLALVGGALVVILLCRVLRKKYQAQADCLGMVLSLLCILLCSWLYLIVLNK